MHPIAILSFVSAALCGSASFSAVNCSAINTFVETGNWKGADIHLSGCGTTAGLNNAQTATCRWDFDLRAKHARMLFEARLAELQSCLPQYSQKTDDPVNHPDSYLLETFSQGSTRISISLKDKAQLQQSFVFLRHEKKRP